MKIVLICIFMVLNLFGSDYEVWLKNQKNEYTNYKKSLDEEFSNSLKKDWEAFKGFSNPNPFVKPKPVEIPKIKEVILPKDEVKNSPKVVILPPKEEPKIAPKIEPKIESPKIGTKVSFDFFGANMEFYYDKSIPVGYKVSAKSDIANFFDDISKSKFQPLVESLQNKSKELSLNDWALYQLVYKSSFAISKNSNDANLLSWFLMLKLNYDVKIAFDKDKNLLLLGNFKNNLYQVPYFIMSNKKRYYVLNEFGRKESVGGVLTYDADYPTSLSQISTGLYNSINLPQKLQIRDLNFEFNSKKYSIKSKYNLNEIEFFKSYPQSEYEIYFDAKNPIYLNSLLDQLRINITGMSEVEAVNFLLRFTQVSFAYKTDDDQFSYEKVMMPEETLFYPYSDCEDRSIMFSFLVRNLLGLKTVGVKFSDHLAVAVKLNSVVSGDNFKFENEVYTITDPTYINANVAMMMPQYKNAKFEVIK